MFLLVFVSVAHQFVLFYLSLPNYPVKIFHGILYESFQDNSAAKH